MAQRDPQFNQKLLVDTTPMPDHIPKVEEIGATSAFLASASFAIGARCQAFNDDYMKCKDEANGRGEFDCLKEGRKVTRCAASVIKDINTHCMQEFQAHVDCLENNNQTFFNCRRPEQKLNSCIFDKLVGPDVSSSHFHLGNEMHMYQHLTSSRVQGLKKEVPGSPENQVPVWQRPKQMYAEYPGRQF
ncbi:NADH-ubiquinone oxidoreductase 20.8 kDa subunit [Penicillium maclennaniae]|uniref:NADH-ubiquinone oxidoreductase 20.8 kDa subunit n=1 Tax=Penicillium maclennaniae TaxID=1343394 RepID=UPI002540E836|nr:NADH-ubiquinone oxidoreductase 20.8 kDa subunit [Penicillium maclennaniae]KAJ5677105.1 NADH-ubiquinone oxidoreductase 20.8 kDa subunit [Penicillium maclennaniae]